MTKMKTKRMKVFCLVAEDMSHMGGPMGSEYTTFSHGRYFLEERRAKKIARIAFKKRYKENRKMGWKRNKDGSLSSKDLAYVKYHIHSILIES